MPQGAGAAVDIDPFGRQAQFAQGDHRHDRESLVDLEQVDRVAVPAHPLEQPRDGAHGRGRKLARWQRRGGMADDARLGSQPQALGVRLPRQHQGGRAVGDRRGVAGSHRAVGIEDRLEAGQPRHVAQAGRLVDSDHGGRRATARQAGYGRDFLGEFAFGDAALRPQDALVRIRVLLFAGEAVFARGQVGVMPHQPAFVGILQAVAVHVVEQLAVPEPISLARLGDQMRRIAHRLHAAGQHHIGRSGAQHVMRQHGGLHARAAHLAQGGGLHVGRQPCAEHGLAGRRLPQPGEQAASHQRLLRRVGLQARLPHRGGQRMGAQLRRAVVRQRALERADGCAPRRDDDYGIWMDGHDGPRKGDKGKNRCAGGAACGRR
ncbi:Uncharacterised protein [Bordetella pertussis]|nr:Uncharacterised protein [Bordetella pertussis]CFW46962.1 Uncharacterised protein [Bordetella pertussis]CFW90019.1 Uncharacterised protein [Bordetella pertussis]CPK86846.1 Uncharacterised protein [Bordetella pertussis]CPQ42090.1 Uncharacterised protein [Bordetella pertussis]